MMRILDVRTDSEMQKDHQKVVTDRRWTLMNRRPCPHWPGCECAEHLTVGGCADRFGLLYDSES